MALYQIRTRVVSKPLYEIEADSLAKAMQIHDDGEGNLVDEPVVSEDITAVFCDGNPVEFED